jgi:C4-dicarboxylate transporter DctM subunit
MAIAIGIAWLIFICIGVPIAFVLGASAMVGVLLAPDGSDLLPALVEQMFIAVSSFNFLAIPLFVFAGGVLAEGGIAKILMDLASITIGRGRGGLGASIVMSAMIFHGISGSSSADAAAIGKVTLPTLRAQGYPLPFSVALLATAGATGTLIPPTMDLIIIGIVGNMSIAGLFSAGILPACVNGLGLMALVVFISRRRGYGNVTVRFALRKALLALLKAVPALSMIAIILGGILGGVFTPTEASSIAVFYGLFLAVVVYRSLTFSQFLGLFRTTIEISGMVLLVIAMAAMLGYALTIFQVPP